MLALAALTLSLQLQQNSFDLLDGVSVEIATHNSASIPTPVTFQQPAEYEIDVLRGDTIIWSNSTSVPPGVTFPPHTRGFRPGPSVLVVYIWNAIASDGTTPAPGAYTIRARLLGEGVTPTASASVHFINPVPVAAVEKLKLGDTVTIAGVLDVTKGLLTDASGTLRLARRLLTAPNAPIAVRGYLMLEPDRTYAFFIQRWAPLK
jgi:hypothetical protein